MSDLTIRIGLKETVEPPVLPTLEGWVIIFTDFQKNTRYFFEEHGTVNECPY